MFFPTNSRRILKYGTYNIVQHLKGNGRPIVIDEDIKKHILVILR
jgi:hypothetical protein